jgi:hypothetical protein
MLGFIPVSRIFFSWFQPSTINLLRMEFCIYFFQLLFMKLFWSHELNCEFNKLTWVYSCFFLFLIDFFNPSTLSWLKIGFHVFFMGLSLSHDTRSWIWQVNVGWLGSFSLFFFNWIFFFQFHPSTTQSSFIYFFFQSYHSILGFLKIELYDFFSICFLLSFPDFIDLVFFITTFNIISIGDETL